MPRRPTRTVPTVLLPGPSADRAEDWLQWLAGELTATGRRVLRCPAPEPAAPQLGQWLAALRLSLTGLADDGFDVVAHSLGCLVWLHHATDPAGSPRPARVALVAPPAPTTAPAGWESFYPVPLNIDAIRQAADGTVLVGGDDDPFCPGGVAQVYGAPLKMATTVIGHGGALTAESGYGAWPAVRDWCGRDNLAFIG
ncbi:MAG: alpha/beta hydrolase [Jatrophihabitantaceae bacterium]